MNPRFKEYCKCVFVNRFTLLGYLLVLISIPSIFFLVFYLEENLEYDFLINLAALVFICGLLLLIMTWFGTETLRSYRIAKKRIVLHGVDSIKLSKFYCNSSGELLAIREFNKTFRSPR